MRRDRVYIYYFMDDLSFRDDMRYESFYYPMDSILLQQLCMDGWSLRKATWKYQDGKREYIWKNKTKKT